MDMTNELNDQRVAFLVSNEGAEQVELTEPWQAIEAAGGTPVLVAPGIVFGIAAARAPFSPACP